MARVTNLDFEEFKKANPDATFTDYYAEAQKEEARRGRRNALGVGYAALNTGIDVEFWSFVAERTTQQIERYGVKPHHKIIDFGCGVLRFGCHYMKYLDAGNYRGLDITPEFYNAGLKVIGPDLVREKRPVVATISPNSIAEAKALGADFVFANEVLYHIHPDDMPGVLQTLITLTSKPGATLVFNTKISAQPKQLGKHQWSYPLEYYVENLHPLHSLTRPGKVARANAQLAAGEPYGSIVLEFTRK